VVAISRRSHADLVPSPESAAKPLPSSPWELFDALPALPGLRTEIIEGNLIVSPVGTPEHSWTATNVAYALHQL
jgi:hypothetical protein